MIYFLSNLLVYILSNITVITQTYITSNMYEVYL